MKLHPDLIDEEPAVLLGLLALRGAPFLDPRADLLGEPALALIGNRPLADELIQLRLHVIQVDAERIGIHLAQPLVELLHQPRFLEACGNLRKIRRDVGPEALFFLSVDGGISV